MRTEVRSARREQRQETCQPHLSRRDETGKGPIRRGMRLLRSCCRIAERPYMVVMPVLRVEQEAPTQSLGSPARVLHCDPPWRTFCERMGNGPCMEEAAPPEFGDRGIW